MSVVQRCGPPTICEGLNAEAARLDKFETMLIASQGAYSPSSERTPPPGYRNATDVDLKRLGLSRAEIENPTFTGETSVSNFMAAVYVKKEGTGTLVAFKGTDLLSGEDWKNNAQQKLGFESQYYTRAQEIAQKISSSGRGGSAEYTGHSLGGGMAAAASKLSGRPATTLNAAGLNSSTVPDSKTSIIDAVHVRGEVINAGQKVLGGPSGTRSWPLDPPPVATDVVVAGASLFGPKAVAAALAARAVQLHTTGSIKSSIEQAKKRNLAARQKSKCC